MKNQSFCDTEPALYEGLLGWMNPTSTLAGSFSPRAETRRYFLTVTPDTVNLSNRIRQVETTAELYALFFTKIRILCPDCSELHGTDATAMLKRLSRHQKLTAIGI